MYGIYDWHIEAWLSVGGLWTIYLDRRREFKTYEDAKNYLRTMTETHGISVLPIK